MFSQDSQPSNSQPSFDSAFEHGQPIQRSPASSAASGGTKKSNQRERWGFNNEKVHDSDSEDDTIREAMKKLAIEG